MNKMTKLIAVLVGSVSIALASQSHAATASSCTNASVMSALIAFETAVAAKNVSVIDAMFDPAYLNNGQNKASLMSEVNSAFAQNQSLQLTYTNVVCSILANGNADVRALETFSTTNNGVTTSDPNSAHLILKPVAGGGWVNFGNQLKYDVFYGTGSDTLGGHWLNIGINDPNQTIQSAVLSGGPGLGTGALTSTTTQSNGGIKTWTSHNDATNTSAGTFNYNSFPALPVTYTLTITEIGGNVVTLPVTYSAFNPNFVSNLKPTNFTGTSAPTFSWTAPPGGPYSYVVEVSGISAPFFWFNSINSIGTTSVTYNGTAAIPACSRLTVFAGDINNNQSSVTSYLGYNLPAGSTCGPTGVVVTTTITSTTTSGNTTTTTSSTTTTTLAGGSNTANLVGGWNLLGNGMSNAITVSSKFGDQNLVSTVWKWIASSGAWAFYTPTLSDGGAAYAAGKGYTLLTTINAGEGFWVNAKSGFSAQLSGTPVSTNSFADGLTSNALSAGWSLIAIGDNKAPAAFANTIAVNPPAAGTTVATSLTTLWAWDAMLTGWYFFAPSLVNAGTQASYIASKGYLDFGTKTLTPTTGFWVNRP